MRRPGPLLLAEGPVTGSDLRIGAKMVSMEGPLPYAAAPPPLFWGVEVAKSTSRIKVSLSRPLSHSELEWLRDEIHPFRSINKGEQGEIRSAILAWEPWGGVFRWESLRWRFKVSRKQQIYAESDSLPSRQLFRQLSHFLEEHFVNIHPVAVKTLRERT